MENISTLKQRNRELESQHENTLTKIKELSESL